MPRHPDFISEKRRKKIENVVRKRQYSLNMILENIHDPHNVSAIFRTMDSAGIPQASLLYNYEKFPKIGKKSSASAFKWIDKEKYTTVDDCFGKLKADGFKIYVTTLADDSVDFFNVDLTEKCAILLGNEHRGVSKEAEDAADAKIKIPMFGMVQSLNVSVSAAIIIYEALRQRMQKGIYDNSQLTEDEIELKIKEWASK